ncbi:tRNA-2-methylthio-N(6)-dimethylallyladenosine synthase [Clostridia bacterium]|nr:tRNA-2-methylthio-N(6)-dimethylallyladenosine synthase [Clostridia bacterium]
MTAYVRTFGCQQNEADSERIKGHLAALGYDFTEDPTVANLAVLNTCAVREHAESRAFGHLGALKPWKMAKRGRTLIFCGCMAAEQAVRDKMKSSYPYVDIILTPDEIDLIPEKLSSPNSPLSTLNSPLRTPPPKAWLSIMTGCNNFCSYCIVPHVRGREKSKPAHELVSEFSGLVEQGYKDITLLGQNVNSYRDGDTDFVALLKQLCAVNGDYWVRFMTSHPKDCTPELLQFMADQPHMARHLHLPVQSGSDRVLGAMNRGYGKERYMGLLDLARKLMPDLTVTSDIIVGFPTESESEFVNTMDLVERADFDALFTFIYSRRRGTPAADMEDLSREVKKERMERLLELQNGISAGKHAAFKGQILRVLVDGYEQDNDYPLTARTSGNRLVRLTGGADCVGKFIDAEISDCNSWNLFGRLKT